MSSERPLILLIEDDTQTRRFLSATLEPWGWRILETGTGRDGLAAAKEASPNLVIADLGLPDIEGVTLIQSLRLTSEAPILILSARDHERDKIAALDSGADDYLTKPFSAAELRARLRALLRRAANMAATRETFEAGTLKVDLSYRKIYKDGTEVRLTPIEFRLLAMLVRHTGRVVTHRQLLADVWGPNHVHDSHYLRIYMRLLRHKLEADPARPRYLMTEVGVGYRLVGDN
jgi:two-component system KDP operon response regulator KdpE